MSEPKELSPSFEPTAQDSQSDLPEGWLQVQSMDLDAQGVARKPDGKVIFIDGALPFELVTANTHRKKNNWEQASLVAIHRESSQRVRPGCQHFGLHAGACGGCKMQHLHVGAQVAVKQRVLEDNLWHLGKVKAQTMLRPIEGPSWGYRYRARLSVRHVIKKGQVLIGFHERKSRYVADMQQCPVLPPHVDAMLMPLRALIAGMDARDTCPQIELACGDTVTALVLRHLEPLSTDDLARLRAFAAEHHVQWWLQPKGPDTVKLLDEGGELLSYALPDFGITMPFKPTDFTQVNPHINRVLVSRALRLLDVQPHERVIDWFCGLGNFTLPLATQAREVLGIEGSEALVARSRENYALNQAVAPDHKALAATDFVARNLFEMTPEMLVADGSADKWLVDPPREGAFALAKALADIEQARIGAEGAGPLPTGAEGWAPPKRIVYVSCNPATLARDAGLLVHLAGYRCTAAGMVNMFPHTAHVESMAVFERD
ncbi:MULTISPECIES: 23S rRNA (uracil(1939)-C(5))-methyltransferase RlmD [Acidovorax]|uniref:23S rRNA (uracil(1939)-C(5))-methyltransferase RlmD n=1 Tax=Acidovorax facilis TaxID=12917 RepID=A0ABV8D4T5_9BURK|nr:MULTISPECIES: 23S rRNA (uracil(1939)-C(5))-methyltransferase RlmD [Acidovorax]KQB58507.1 23S rRNA methyltransferase [Acidovorax sp. SD340]MBO1010378.1 23S rRNA (uracil(1939)-C(5))-methyltransferase RlmD [Acidovorax sp. SD340]MBV7460515.1 23S rRNA (uracil(1939)-C(5))-methyltransferase RlmD [Acidovorax sp. sif0632]MBV7465540.1 23S rRNA (uracil(1939)-C(5))-methyltransferase RlmD [Acidovorax sp. sif0613]MCO4244199.1 23S rRNA (uracil(1939)-C(5))-methyltransferase RlmD [Acidovorax facilis]